MNIGGSNTSLSSHDGGKSRLTKNFFKEILIAHYNQPDLKVSQGLSKDFLRTGPRFVHELM